MHALPAVASYLKDRPQAGSGEVGKPGSLIFEYACPADVVAEVSIFEVGAQRALLHHENASFP